MLLSHLWNAKPNTICLALFNNKGLNNIIQIKQTPIALRQWNPVFFHLPSKLPMCVFPVATLLAFYNSGFGQDMGYGLLAW